MNQEKVVLLADWPQPSAGVPDPHIRADESSLTIRYRTEDDQFAVIYFPRCTYLSFGAPNDEALHGHPLTKVGLGYYSAQEVENSSLIQMLERRNAVHPRHDRERFLEGMRHFIFTFHNSTLECVVHVDERSEARVATFATEREALERSEASET